MSDRLPNPVPPRATLAHLVVALVAVCLLVGGLAVIVMALPGDLGVDDPRGLIEATTAASTLDPLEDEEPRPYEPSSAYVEEGADEETWTLSMTDGGDGDQGGR